MPTYEYRCPQGHEFELFQRISDDPGADCPQRVISGGAGFLFKGEGFYITDYRSDEYKKKAARESPSGSGDEGGADGAGGDAGKDAPPAKGGGEGSSGSDAASSSSSTD